MRQLNNGISETFQIILVREFRDHFKPLNALFIYSILLMYYPWE